MTRAMILFFAVCSATLSFAQGFNDVLGTHDLTPIGKSSVKGRLSSSCLYCHAPHSAMAGPQTPLWNQQVSTQTYTTYESSTYHQNSVQPVLGNPSKLCLSCHDGTVAPGQTVAYGKLTTTGSMSATAKLGTDHRNSHPFSLKTPLVDAPGLSGLLISSTPKTADPDIKLINGSVECTSCHDAHIQAKDKVVGDFLRRDGANGQICLACHDPLRETPGANNPLSGWTASIHATSANTTSSTPNVGGYDTVAKNSCSACHAQHNATGPERVLRGKNEEVCASCHNGAANLSPAIADVYAEFAKGGHPFPTAHDQHDPAETAVLENNRHATCVDCHNAHDSQKTTDFAAGPAIRASQTAVRGVSASDGTTTLVPAINQFENCLRCHGRGAGKVADDKYGYQPLRVASAGDPLNVIAEFAVSASSSHPVMRDRSSAFAQPSLRDHMLQLDGATAGRDMSVRILCTDCHNSDDNREFGGKGPSGPHGSKFKHILERRYEYNTAVTPGLDVANLFPTPDLTVNGPYALCAKCHDLSQIMANTSFSEHARHINDGFSCSTCHTAHGIGGNVSGISGERMVNFDLHVVAASDTGMIGYDRATNSCSATCHNHVHHSAAQNAQRLARR